MTKIEEKFRGVYEIQTRFNNRVFEILKKHFGLARSAPSDIVRVMRIVKNEEIATESAIK